MNLGILDQSTCLGRLSALCRSMDWGFEFSDDRRHWLRESLKWEEIQAIRQWANRKGYGKEAEDIYKKYMPNVIR